MWGVSLDVDHVTRKENMRAEKQFLSVIDYTRNEHGTGTTRIRIIQERGEESVIVGSTKSTYVQK